MRRRAASCTKHGCRCCLCSTRRTSRATILQSNGCRCPAVPMHACMCTTAHRHQACSTRVPVSMTLPLDEQVIHTFTMRIIDLCASLAAGLRSLQRSPGAGNRLLIQPCALPQPCARRVLLQPTGAARKSQIIVHVGDRLLQVDACSSLREPAGQLASKCSEPMHMFAGGLQASRNEGCSPVTSVLCGCSLWGCRQCLERACRSCLLRWTAAGGSMTGTTCPRCRLASRHALDTYRCMEFGRFCISIRKTAAPLPCFRH